MGLKDKLNTTDPHSIIMIITLTWILLFAVTVGLYEDEINKHENTNKELLNKHTKLLNDYFRLHDFNQELIYKQDIALIESGYQQIKINRLTNRLNHANTQIIHISEMYNNQISADRIITRPTYAEVLQFLAGDHTSINSYRDDYDCTEFSNDMIRNAMNKGMFACTTELDYLDDFGHILVAFNTIDRGIIYVEPQNNDIMTKDFSVGEIYWTNKVLKISSCFELKTQER